MRRDRRRLAHLLGYVRYSINPAIQAEAVQLGHHLTSRLPNIVDMLMHPFSGGRPDLPQIFRARNHALVDGRVLHPHIPHSY